MKCEQGDLAKIINSIRPSNLGKMVLVEEYIGRFKEGESFEFKGLTCKAIITDHYWWVNSEYGLKNMLGDTPKVYIPDSWLDPVRPTNISQKEEEKLDLSV